MNKYKEHIENNCDYLMICNICGGLLRIKSLDTGKTHHLTFWERIKLIFML